MYTLTFGTPTVGIDSATLPFTLDSAVTDGPYVGTASATGGGATKTGDVTVDANSTTGEIVFTGLSAGTTYTIAQGEIDITYGGNDQSLAHGGISFTTASDEPRTATESQWQDLVARVKAKADASSIPTVNNSTITVTNNGLDKGTFTTNQATAGTVALDYPTITMTTTDPGEGAAISANNYVAVYGGDPIIMDYSSSEVNTGAKWVDGAAIYKKTVNFGTLPNATNKTVAHQISNVSRFIKIEQSITNNGATGALVLSSGQASNNDFNFYVTDTNIGITTSGDRSTCNAYVTLYYTKSSS